MQRILVWIQFLLKFKFVQYSETLFDAESSMALMVTDYSIGDGGILEKRQPNICTNAQ